MCHLQMLKANNPISFSVLVSTLNGGRTFWDMVPYIHTNVTILCDKDEGNNVIVKKNNTINSSSRQLQCVCESTGYSTRVVYLFLLT